MAEQKITLPISGMTCANCALNIERLLKQLEGVNHVTVNLASEKAVIFFDSKKLHLIDIVKKINEIGYRVATTKIELPVTGMSCANCAMTVEKILKQKVPGLIDVSVNFAGERAFVEYIPDISNLEDMISAIRYAGYDAVVPDENLDAEDAEQAARSAEIRDQSRKFNVGLFFALPLFMLSMARDFGFVGVWSHESWVNWLFFALATPVQFYTGWDYYTGGLKSLKNRSANMDVLVAMGSSVAYFYSLAVLIFSSLGDHVYFETSAVIITLIKLGKMMESRTKGRTAGAIRKLIGLRPKKATIMVQG